jgi:hypothetical protein
MYPHLLAPQVQGEMIAHNEEQRSGLVRRINEGNRREGKATVLPGPYDRVPGLKRVEVKTNKSWWER